MAHAKDDDNVPFAESQRFVNEHKGQGGDITFLDMPRGGHYTEMLELGMQKQLNGSNNKTFGRLELAVPDLALGEFGALRRGRDDIIEGFESQRFRVTNRMILPYVFFHLPSNLGRFIVCIAYDHCIIACASPSFFCWWVW